MKILLLTALAASLGLGTVALRVEGAQASDCAKDCPTECDAKVTCDPDGRCFLTCEGEDGKTCTIEIECVGEPCKAECAQPSPCCPKSR